MLETIRGIRANGIRYIKLTHKNAVYKSFEERLYFTLKDIIFNGKDDNIADKAQVFMELLKPNDSDAYSDILDDHHSDCLSKLCKWLSTITGIYFYSQANHKHAMITFQEIEPTDITKMDMHHYIEFDKWWEQLEGLISMLDNLMLQNHYKYKEELTNKYNHANDEDRMAFQLKPEHIEEFQQLFDMPFNRVLRVEFNQDDDNDLYHYCQYGSKHIYTFDIYNEQWLEKNTHKRYVHYQWDLDIKSCW